MSFFQSFTENLIETSEQIIRVVEEGTSILMNLASQEGKINSGASESIPKSSFDSNSDKFAELDLDEDLDGMSSPLDGIAESVLGDIMKNQAAPTSMTDNLNAFRSAITWSEPFMIGLITFHICIVIATIYVTKRCGLGARMGLLGFLAIIVRSAEWLNQYGSNHWEEFTTQNYFDKKGVFVSLMLTGPFLFLTFVMLISYLREASGLLIEVKRHELKAKQKKLKVKGEAGSKPKKNTKAKKED
mmetsp:Transcript_9820/g.12435  ORF Transcript_9820/g.12435 Transcript_9820/m.12435 type:complete len:244 (+) Transcript_9820:157-888(+)